MSDFDPYYKWLAIPPEEQPPNHYRLLGISLFENDADVIQAAADQRMSHLRTYQSGQHSSLSQKLLNEVAGAKLCLLSAGKKAIYDAILHEDLRLRQDGGTQDEGELLDPEFTAFLSRPASAAPSPAPSPAAAAKKQPAVLAFVVGAGAAAALILLGLLIAIGGKGGKKESGSQIGLTDKTASAEAQAVEKTKPAGVGEGFDLPPLEKTSDPPPPTSVQDQGSGLGEIPVARPGNSNGPTSKPPDPPQPSEPEPPPKVAVPDADAIRTAAAAVEEVHGGERRSATGTHQKVALAEKLLQEAARPSEKPEIRYAMLRLAFDLAIQGDDAPTAFKVVDQTARYFEVDPPRMKSAVFTKMLKTPGLPPARAKAIIAEILAFLDELLADDRYDEAQELGTLALERARKLKDMELSKRIVAINKEVRELAAAHTEVQSAAETLEQEPTNAEASAALGRFAGARKGDWQRAIPLLAMGDAEPWRGLAKKEAEEPESPENQVSLADGWWTLAQSAPAAERLLLSVHAAYWYQQALTFGASGLAKARAEKRLEELQRQGKRFQDHLDRESGQIHGKFVAVRLKPRDDANSLVNYYRPIRIAVSAARPANLRVEPRYRSRTPLYGVLRLGDAADNEIILALDEPDDGEPRIFIDRNRDRDLTNDGDGSWSRSSEETVSRDKVAIEVPYRSGGIPYTFNFYRFRKRLRDVVLYYRDSAREGDVLSGGKRYRIAVLDDNSDGRFDDMAQGVLLVDLNQDGKLDRDSESAEHHELAGPFNIHGRVWEVASLSPDGTLLKLRPSQARVAMRPYVDAGFAAPPFTAQTLDGRRVNLAETAAASRYVLLDFWASWCGPCRGEFPTMARIHQRYKDRGLTIIGISLDRDRAEAISAARSAGLDYAHVFDGGSWENAVAQLYRVRGIPQTFLLDPNLKIVAKGLRGEALESRIAELLGSRSQR